MGLVRRGSRWCIRYYGPDGRQRWETIGPNKKEAETVLHQRLYEVRSGKYPILRRHSRVLFRDFAEEWMRTYATAHVRPSTLRTYEGQLKFQLLPAFGDRALSVMTSKSIQDFFSETVCSGRLAPKTANNSLVLLKAMLEDAVEWGYLTANPARSVRMFKRLPREMRAWTVVEMRRFLLAAEEAWRSLFVVAIFTGLREGELQALHWETQNRPNFATNKIEVTCAYDDKTKTTTAPKSKRSMRTVDMCPTVRHVLLTRPGREQGGLIFPGAEGGVFSRSVVKRAFLRAIKRAEVPRIRLHDLRNT